MGGKVRHGALDPQSAITRDARRPSTRARASRVSIPREGGLHGLPSLLWLALGKVSTHFTCKLRSMAWRRSTVCRRDDGHRVRRADGRPLAGVVDSVASVWASQSECTALGHASNQPSTIARCADVRRARQCDGHILTASQMGGIDEQLLRLSVLDCAAAAGRGACRSYRRRHPRHSHRHRCRK